MRPRSPNLTHMSTAFPATALRGGTSDGSRDGTPPQVSGSGALHRQTKSRLTSASGPASDTRPSAMTCARRVAGAHRPASPTSADSPRKPEPHPGRSYAHVLCLPIFALLLGLFATAPPARAGVHRLPLLPAALNAVRVGFVRIVNESDEAGEVVVRAFDDAGTEYGPVTLAIGAGEARQFTSRDLETGNVAKGLTGSTGPPQAGRRWRLAFESDLEIRVMGYVRTRGAQGFPNAMHEVVTERPSEAGYRYEVVFFNPASNTLAASALRLVNRADAEAAVTITGLDDAGVPGEAAVALTLPAGAARLLSAPALESGAEDLAGALGDGTGKWRLSVASDQPLAVMSLIQGPGGHLTNLSTAPPARAGVHRLPLLPAALNAVRVGFVRIVNESDEAGEVVVRAFDDAGTEYGQGKITKIPVKSVHCVI